MVLPTVEVSGGPPSRRWSHQGAKLSPSKGPRFIPEEQFLSYGQLSTRSSEEVLLEAHEQLSPTSVLRVQPFRNNPAGVGHVLPSQGEPQGLASHGQRAHSCRSQVWTWQQARGGGAGKHLLWARARQQVRHPCQDQHSLAASVCHDSLKAQDSRHTRAD